MPSSDWNSYVFSSNLDPCDNHGYVYLKDFREDPENNPLPTRSGKLEIRCQVLADHVNRLGWSKIRPIPAYHPALEGYEATFSDWKKRIKGEYPLRSEEHTSDLQSLMRKSYADFCLKNKINHIFHTIKHNNK